MLRSDNVICGTSTTGTGTLTLAAQPAPPGGLDFYHWLTATGQGFVNGNALLVSYTIIEYTSSAFTTAKQSEKGVGTLTLGASLTASTLARTTVQTIITGMDSTPSFTAVAGTAITIGTAANTLVFVGASMADLLAAQPPYVDATANGFLPLSIFNSSSAGCNIPAVSGTDYYHNFIWNCTVAVKRISTYVTTPYTGGTSNLYARIYQVNSSGQPGKLLVDFGVLGTSNSSLTTAASVQSAALGTAFLLTPGVYYMDWLGIFTGGSGTPALKGTAALIYGGLPGSDSNVFANGNWPIPGATATTGNATAPDPANSTAYALSSFGGSVGVVPTFSLKTS